MKKSVKKKYIKGEGNGRIIETVGMLQDEIDELKDSAIKKEE
jgi:FtsZ-binding cell division protein ZapB